MTTHFKKSDTALEVDYSGEPWFVSSETDFNQIEEVVVHVPLPSFGSTNSYIDLCSDLLGRGLISA
jgi:hypothetical protein